LFLKRESREQFGVMKSTQSGPVIQSAQPADVPVIGELLRSAQLPHEDFEAHLAHFLVARVAGVVVGAVGLERHDPDALLRSLVVAPPWRGHGLGDKLVQDLAGRASRAGVQNFYLLTTTAGQFFVARGFREIARDRVPAAIAATEEFRHLCPASAVCLSRPVRG
jgi:amino-acid N-acetyltransferase